ncbi:DnaJ domain-containing protein [Phosphitispora sp. TUW77]|uniref:DnaJ domain-containing protein n=1 Tax=Phosphitispora sp. TUW77 TaxID=3152361 RepID=UPI003AB607D2
MDLYESLEVSRNASIEVIEGAYKKLAKKYHPDLQDSLKKSWAETKMKQLNYAYEVLKDPEKRRQYDKNLQNESKTNSQKESIKESDSEAKNSPRSARNYCIWQVNNVAFRKLRSVTPRFTYLTING